MVSPNMPELKLFLFLKTNIFEIGIINSFFEVVDCLFKAHLCVSEFLTDVL